MSEKQLKQLAKTFIDEQKRILEEHGDGIVRSKYNDAILSAQKTFASLAAKPKLTK
jgi:hypothetical protein